MVAGRAETQDALRRTAWAVVLSICPFGLNAQSPTTTATSAPDRLPRFVSGGYLDLYPAAAQRLNQQGAVDLEFRIDASGHAQEVKELYSAYPSLAATARRMLTGGTFQVPPDWSSSSSASVRFVTEYQFVLVAPPAHCPAPEAAARVAGAHVAVICADQLR
jgi:hypothetical protein